MAKVRITDSGWQVWCPGCKQPHDFVSAHGVAFNGDMESPSFDVPLSIEGFNENAQPVLFCHAWIENGKFKFFWNECAGHNLEGQEIDVPDFPETGEGA